MFIYETIGAVLGVGIFYLVFVEGGWWLGQKLRALFNHRRGDAKSNGPNAW